MKKISRREFLGEVAIKGASLSFPLVMGGMVLSCTTIRRKASEIGQRIILENIEVPEGRTPMEPVISKTRSQIAVINSRNAVYSNGKINSNVIRNMIREGVMELGGTHNIEDGWSKVLPSYKKGEKVGILANIPQEVHTNIEVVVGVVDELIELGIRPIDIIVWGNNRLANIAWRKIGYQEPLTERNVTLRFNYDPEAGFDDKVFAEISSQNLRLPLSNILTTQCDYLINMPVLKHHSLCGVTSAIKLYYASIPMAEAMIQYWASPIEVKRFTDKMHADNGDPQIVELANHPIVQKKTCLYVCDGLISMYDGGPHGRPQWVNNQIFISQDPVALDYQGFQIIEKKRQEKGLESISLRAKYIQTAAEMGLGTNNPDQIELIDISLG